jgi:hypothetical protein
MTKQHTKDLIESIEKHPDNSRLAKWLRKHPAALPDFEEFRHSQAILPKGHGTETPKVGIVAAGIVEVQGLIPNLCAKKGFVSYPLALRFVGEVIGEVEFLTHRHLGGAWMRPWSAFAGMQTFYFTPFRGSKEDPYFDIKKRLSNKIEKPVAKIAWLKTEMFDSEAIDALNEISIKRLLPLTSRWLPEVEEIKALRSSANLLAANLFRELLQAVQGQKIMFRSFSFDEMSAVSSWDEELLGSTHGKDYGKYEDCIVLGAFQATHKQDGPIILLPHYLIASLSEPNSPAIVPGMPNQINEALTEVVSIAKDYLKKHKSLVPGNATAIREVVAIYTDSKQKKLVRSSNGIEDDAFVERLGKTLNIKNVKSLDDLRKVGMLGSAALIILPKKV